MRRKNSNKLQKRALPNSVTTDNGSQITEEKFSNRKMFQKGL
jgi:hypothetical protein